ncbi:hypothetical protein GEOBRER4_n2825 [Citrifermentans bremense]|uniref:Uncharacterized protein n=1 Tax=Citrifermentans bremense TaxID=60035 RepID=A0A6S6M0W9_9BACT|nr:hypothetical protein [Citrifermentans bremense]BCG47967.1 hypothetical protein GEOBRER4_n2825 [Citrifermentans bremense]
MTGELEIASEDRRAFMIRNRSSEPDLPSRLRITLKEEIDRIVPDDAPRLASEVKARQRLDDLAESAPAVLILLAGDFLVGEGSWTILRDCATIHLYARILDDALDENMPVHRGNLLRAQPMLWRAIGGLAAYHAKLWPEATHLIDETVAGVHADNQYTDVRSWGRKNHHLLLIPLLLRENSPEYQACKTALSHGIWVLQAREELQQVRIREVAPLVLDWLSWFLSGPGLPSLAENGWSLFADRCLYEGQQIINQLQCLSRD